MPIDTLPPSRSRRRTLLRAATPLAVLAVVASGVALTLGRGASADAGYRTAVVGAHDVDQAITAVATITPVAQATVAFPVAGTVASVGVAVGDEVAAGTSLATLDTAALVVALHEAQATLDEAELTLEKALAGEDVSGRGASGPTGSNGGSTPTTTPTTTPATTPASTTPTRGSGGSGGSGGSTDQLRPAQQAVVDAQRAVDRDLAAAQGALASADQACAAVVGDGGDDGGDGPGRPSTPSSTTSSTSTTTPSTTSTTQPRGGDDGAALTACQQALTAVRDAQASVATSQAALAEASSALDHLLDQQAASADQGQPSNGATTPTTSGGTSGGTGTGSDQPAASSSSSPSSADLIAHQKAVDAAEVGVAVAEQAVAQATIVSPLAGTVAAVDVAVGDDVTAASTTAHVVIVGPGGYEATTVVSVADLSELKVGQAATLVPDGGGAVQGKVVSIGVAGTSGTTGTTYPVTIALTGDTSKLGNGSLGTVSITTASATRALAVPTSAISVDGSRSTARVLDGGKVTTVTVTTGAVGATWTEVTDGLRAGQVVVLADLGEPLPSSATDSSNGQGQGQRNGPGLFVDGGPPGGFQGGPAGARPGG